MVAAPGKRILDIGCGTGKVSLACATWGSTVIGVDSNPEMLEVARSKTKKAGLEGKAEWLELGVAEISAKIKEKSLDTAVSCLTFSELTPDERTYTRAHSYEDRVRASPDSGFFTMYRLSHTQNVHNVTFYPTSQT
jgi:predicted RNA methylase